MLHLAWPPAEKPGFSAGPKSVGDSGVALLKKGRKDFFSDLKIDRHGILSANKYSWDDCSEVLTDKVA